MPEALSGNPLGILKLGWVRISDDSEGSETVARGEGARGILNMGSAWVGISLEADAVLFGVGVEVDIDTDSLERSIVSIGCEIEEGGSLLVVVIGFVVVVEMFCLAIDGKLVEAVGGSSSSPGPAVKVKGEDVDLAPEASSFVRLDFISGCVKVKVGIACACPDFESSSIAWRDCVCWF